MKFLSSKEAALATGRHEETVTKALRVGDLHGTQSKKKGRWMIEEDCLGAWVYNQKCKHALVARATAPRKRAA